MVQYNWQEAQQCFPRIAVKVKDLCSKLYKKILPSILN